MLPLLPDEKIVTQLNGESITLTSHRIIYEVNEWHRTFNQSCMLEEIIAIKPQYKTNSLLILLAAISVITGLGALLLGHYNTPGPTLLIAIFLLVMYRLSKSSFLIITTTVTFMKISISGISKKTIYSFLNEVEKVRRSRVHSLNNNSNQLIK